MRIYLNIVNSYLIYELQRSDAISRIKHDGGDLVVVELSTGETVSIHLVERDIDVGLIKDILERNSQANVYTLLLLWCDMLLPADQQLYVPYDWMSTLLAVYGGKIYAYELASEEVIFFPVYFERQAIGLERLVRYGTPINMAAIRCEVVHLEGQHINGTWRIAAFERWTAEQQSSEQAEGAFHASSYRGSLEVYYDILGVNQGADWETVKKAYRHLAREFHPDINKTPEATERMQQINKAYDQLARLFEDDAG
jgi:DnaJ domain